MSGQEEMSVRVPSTLSMKTDLASGQINVCANQAVGPDRTDIGRVAQDCGLSFGVSFSDIDHGSFQRLLQVQTPAVGQTTRNLRPRVVAGAIKGNFGRCRNIRAGPL